MILLIVSILVVLGVLGGLGFWLWKKSQKPEVKMSVPVYSLDERANLKKYFATSPSPSKNLDQEWADTLRAVSKDYKLKMLEECVDNDSVRARTKAMTCAFYKTVMDYRKDPASVPLMKLFTLLVVYLCTVSDGLGLDQRTEYLKYNDDDTVTLNSPKLIKEMMVRIPFVLNQGYDIPGVESQLSQDGSKAITLPVDAFLFCMLQSFIPYISEEEAQCKLCQPN